MRFFVLLALALLIFGICGLAGGFVMLSVGYWLSRIDVFGTTPFQAAAICVGFCIVCAMIINQLTTTPFFPPFLMGNDFEEEEEDRPPMRIVKNRGKRRVH